MKSAHSLILIGGGLIGLMIGVALIAPLIATFDPGLMSLEKRLIGPSTIHYFGLDENGSDVFAQIVFGARLSLTVAFAVSLVSCLLGLIIGSLSGWCGGWVDSIVMRIIDMFYAFPNFLLAIALVAMLGPSLPNLIFALCLTGWTGYARLIRGEVLHLKQREYVQSVQSIGGSPLRIVVKHLWPNLAGPFCVHASFTMAGLIIAESSLNFLGLGVPATTPSWGALLQSGRKVMLEAPHVALFPGLAILTLVLGFNLFGDGLRDYLDPKNS